MLLLLDTALGAARRTRPLGGTGSCRHSPTAPGLGTHCGIKSLPFQQDTPKPTSSGFVNRLFIANPVWKLHTNNAQPLACSLAELQSFGELPKHPQSYQKGRVSHETFY